MEHEEWRVVKKYPKYRISSMGRVLGTRNNILKQSFDKQGYPRVGISLGNYKNKTIKTHRLVAENFIPNPMLKSDVNHKNGIKTDNRVENLEWCTRQENIRHSWKKGLSKFSEKNLQAVRENGKKLAEYSKINYKKVIDESTGTIYPSIKHAAVAFGLKRTTLFAMLSGQNNNRTTLKIYTGSK